MKLNADELALIDELITSAMGKFEHYKHKVETEIDARSRDMYLRQQNHEQARIELLCKLRNIG